ncbi:MAG: hypothetical protein KME08_10440 [Aphanothece sp. CMT-3BRIN-NPC111]|jgi:replication fork clamp-binding protein CrfC|nr:hypothetical protein [Aphanothece sp. CMT-3BRIN-NPC111]
MVRQKANAGKKETATLRRVTAIELRMTGMSYAAIARQLNISLAQAYRDCAESLRLLSEQELGLIKQLRQLESERLDQALASIYPQVLKGSLSAIDRLIKISERRSKLFGLDAPIVQVQEVGVSFPNLNHFLLSKCCPTP